MNAFEVIAFGRDIERLVSEAQKTLANAGWLIEYNHRIVHRVVSAVEEGPISDECYILAMAKNVLRQRYEELFGERIRFFFLRATGLA